MKLTKKCKSVANYIIENIDKYNEGRSLNEKIFLSTKRLQKLIYFCEVEYMKRNYGKPLLEDNYYAWPNGPAIPGLYYLFMQYADGNIKKTCEKGEPELSCDVKEIIDDILDATKKLDTVELTNISNVPGGPYDMIFDKNDKEYKQMISKKDICDYYAERDLIFQLTHDDYHLGSLCLDDILKLKDKTLQLRYLLGGLYLHGGMMECDKFLECNNKCHTRPVKNDDNFKSIKSFVLKHHIIS